MGPMHDREPATTTDGDALTTRPAGNVTVLCEPPIQSPAASAAGETLDEGGSLEEAGYGYGV